MRVLRRSLQILLFGLPVSAFADGEPLPATDTRDNLGAGVSITDPDWDATLARVWTCVVDLVTDRATFETEDVTTWRTITCEALLD